MSKATDLRLNSLSATHTDENENQHQQIGDAGIVEELACDTCDLAPGLGKIGSAVVHSESSSCWSRFASVFIAELALSVFDPGRFGFAELRTNFLPFVGAGFAFPLFFFTVMRR